MWVTIWLLVTLNVAHFFLSEFHWFVQTVESTSDSASAEDIPKNLRCLGILMSRHFPATINQRFREHGESSVSVRLMVVGILRDIEYRT